MLQSLFPPAELLHAIRFQSSPCKVCGGKTEIFDVVDFNKVCADPDQYFWGLAGIPVYYFLCQDCGFTFTTAFDDWSQQQFADYIYNADYHLVDGDYTEKRPRIQAEAIARLLAGHETLRLLDYGTGSGTFVTHIKTLGFSHVSGYDPHSQPERPTGPFDIVLVLEVIQHAPHPHRFIDGVRQFMDEGAAIILATAPPPRDIVQRRGRWMYLAPRNGHLSIYSEPALLALAQRHGMRLCRGDDFFGLIPDAGSGVADIIRERVGPVLLWAEVGAPPAEREVGRRAAAIRGQWHAVESARQAAFRWTQSPAIEWRLSKLPTYPARLRVKVPVLMEIMPGFMDRCVLVLDGERRQATRGLDGLMADFLAEATGQAHALLLETPDLVSPDELGTARGDMRKLGLAVRVLG